MPVYGWKKDRPDARDHKFIDTKPKLVRLPEAASTQGHEPPIWDQGDIGSCTGHGVCRVVQMARARAGLPAVALSRLMAYYTAREIEGTVQEDTGAEIRDAVKGAAKSGIAPESEWPYDTSKFALPPPGDVWTDALADCIKGYSRLDNTNLDELKGCIAGGDPFVFGFNVPSMFEGQEIATTGTMAWSPHDDVVGGHCVVAVAYDNKRNGFLIANSWGYAWGIEGHFIMPYAFITSAACQDFWHVSATGYGPSTQP